MEIQCIFSSVVLGLSKKNLIKQLNSYFYVVNNNFSYTLLAPAFVPQKDFYYIHNDTDTFFLFLVQ